jgi:DNA polymerase-3 subunit alpha
MMLGEASITSRERESTQVNLFGEVEAQRDPVVPHVDAWTTPDRLSREFSAIGFYLSAHPLDEFAQILARLRVVRYADLAADKRHEDRLVKLAASVISRKDRRTRDDKRMSHIGFSDASGMFEAVAFSEVLVQAGALLDPGTAVVLDIATRWDGDELKLQVRGVQGLNEAAAQTGAGLRIFIDEPKPLASVAERLKGKGGKGIVTLVFPVEKGEREVELELPGKYAVTPALKGAIKVVHGVREVEEV